MQQQTLKQMRIAALKVQCANNMRYIEDQMESLMKDAIGSNSARKPFMRRYKKLYEEWHIYNDRMMHLQKIEGKFEDSSIVEAGNKRMVALDAYTHFFID